MSEIPPESTGDPTIDAALERLDTLAARPVHEHPAELEAIHRVLRDALSSAGRDDAGSEGP